MRKSLAEALLDKVRSSRETVAQSACQSGGQECCVRAAHLHGEASLRCQRGRGGADGKGVPGTGNDTINKPRYCKKLLCADLEVEGLTLSGWGLGVRVENEREKHFNGTD